MQGALRHICIFWNFKTSPQRIISPRTRSPFWEDARERSYGPAEISGDAQILQVVRTVTTKVEWKEEAGRVNYIALVSLSSTSRLNVEKITGMLAGYLKKPLQHQTYRHYPPVLCFVFHRTSCLWPVVSFRLSPSFRQ